MNAPAKLRIESVGPGLLRVERCDAVFSTWPSNHVETGDCQDVIVPVQPGDPAHQLFKQRLRPDFSAGHGRHRSRRAPNALDAEPADVKAFAVGFLSMLSDHQIRVPIGYGLLIKALVTVEGVARRIYPQIDITQAAKPFATRLIAQRMLTPARLSQKLPDAVRAAIRELAS